MTRFNMATFLLLWALCAATVVALFGSSAQAATLQVCLSGCTYSNLSSAIQASAASDTILVSAGAYTETISTRGYILINHSLTVNISRVDR